MLRVFILASSHRNNGDIIAASDADDRSGRAADAGHRLRRAADAGSGHRRLGGLAGTVRRWKRDTSPPVVKVVLLSIGRLATASSICFSCAGLALAGTLTSPAATARSSSAVLSAIERSDSDSVPRLCATAIFSAIFGVTSKVTLAKVLTSVLPSSSLSVMRWSVASTRMLRTIVSETLSGGPSPPPSTCWVSTRSTWSPGKTKPATPVDAFTGTVTARMPGPSAAARKPRSCGPTSEPRVTGWPAVIG